MEIKPQATSSWVAGTLPGDLAPGPARAILLFGPDQGGVNEFARLAARAGGDFERIEASSANIPDLCSTLGSGSLFGGSTSILLDNYQDTQFKTVEAVLEAPFGDDARLVITAGDLKPASKLRKLFSTRKDCISVPLYMMRERDVERFAQSFFKSQGLGMDRDAVRDISSRLSGDRATAARSCEVVALHALGRGSNTVGTEDIRAMLDSVDEDGIMAPFDHALNGETGNAVLALNSRLASGESFVGMLRVFAMRAFRFRAMAETGLRPADAVAKAKPPIFWAEKDAVTRILGGLSVAKLDRILEMIDRTEFRIIEQRIPVEAAMPALLLDISRHKNWKDI